MAHSMRDGFRFWIAVWWSSAPAARESETAGFDGKIPLEETWPGLASAGNLATAQAPLRAPIHRSFSTTLLRLRAGVAVA